MFGNLGMPELLVIFVLALLLFGPRKLPEVGKSLGNAIAELSKSAHELAKTWEDEAAAENKRDSRSELPKV